MSQIRYIDTHCHFDFPVFDSNRDELWANIKASGIERLVIPATEQSVWHHLIALCQKESAWHPYLGLHPYFLDKHTPEHIEQLRSSIQRDDAQLIQGIGEIGLDYYLKNLCKEKQHFYFEEQLKLAKEFDLPVIIHARKAYDEVLKYLRRYKLNRAGVIHAFSGSFQQAEQFINLGFKLGFGGALTYSSATRLRSIFTQLPLTAIVAETDAPDMRPSFLSPEEINSPLSVSAIVKIMSELRNLQLEDVANIVYDNSNCLFLKSYNHLSQLSVHLSKQ